MSYIPAAEKAIDFIEEHIREDICVEQVASLAGFSKFHFLRVFKALTDNTLASCIRKRRLTLAAADLLDSRTPILEIALAYGYNSQEAFTRAFKSHYKMTPLAYRQNGFSFVNSEKVVLSRPILELRRRLEDQPLVPRLVQMDATEVVGFQVENRIPGATSALWNRFDQHEHRIKNAIRPVTYYGLEKMTDSRAASPTIQYLASLAVTSPLEIPDGMRAETIPANQYAVFSIAAVPEFLQLAIRKIYGKWLPEAGLHPVGDYDFEAYDENYRHNDPSSTFEFCIPVTTSPWQK